MLDPGDPVGLGESTRPFLSVKEQLFVYFSLQLEDADWRGKNVLDFGGNCGGLLHDPTATVDEERYWCIDIIPEAIDKGRRLFPRAHFLHYDRYNFFFNPGGVAGLPIPDPGVRFHYIVAYSVFTSCLRDEMTPMVEQLQRLLEPGGTLAFTFVDPHHLAWPSEYPGSNLQWRLERIRHAGVEIDPAPILAKARGSRYCVLLNDRELFTDSEELPAYPPEEQESCHVYYTSDYMAELFPTARILPPANDEMQHCCLLSAGARS